MARIISVFIASPKDVQPERDLVLHAVGDLSARLFRLFGVAVTPVDWRQFAPEAAPGDPAVFQDLILRDLEPDSLFVGILHKRFGTPISRDTTITGTQAEFDYAIRHRARTRILTYFKRNESTDQLQVEELKKTIQCAELPVQEYDSIEEFERRITLDLMESLLSMILGEQAKRRRDLGRFFLFGRRRRHTATSSPVLIVYPSIQQPPADGPGSIAPEADWRTRLLPNVVFEDFKAIQKVESVMQTVGVVYKTLTTQHPLVKSDPGNRVWLCVPRNPVARSELETLGRPRVRFSFDVERANDAATPVRFIMWGGAKKTVRVQSPLAKYLARQRPSGLSGWNQRLADIYARDYAVLARFRIDDRSSVDGAPFYHYYLAGVRGLGTWGVGWFIDRYADLLAKEALKCSSGEDIQLLLEVIYHNYRIIDVRVVSGQPQAYFDDRFSDAYVDRELVHHCE